MASVSTSVYPMIATSNDELFEKTDEIAKGPEKGRIGNRERRGFQKIEEAKGWGERRAGFWFLFGVSVQRSDTVRPLIG